MNRQDTVMVLPVSGTRNTFSFPKFVLIDLIAVACILFLALITVFSVENTIIGIIVGVLAYAACQFGTKYFVRWYLRKITEQGYDNQDALWNSTNKQLTENLKITNAEDERDVIRILIRIAQKNASTGFPSSDFIKVDGKPYILQFSGKKLLVKEYNG